MDIYTQIADQENWILSCGGTRAGYRLRYGIKGVREWSGDGGDAIYDADMAELHRLEAEASIKRPGSPEPAVNVSDEQLDYAEVEQEIRKATGAASL